MERLVAMISNRVGWAAVVFGSLFATAAVAYHPGFVEYTTSSDQLTIPSIWWDVVEGSWTHLGGWQFSRAPYLFPDLLIYGAAKAILGDIRLAIFAACMLMLLASVVISGLILNRLSGVQPSQGALATLTVLVTLTCAALLGEWADPDSRAFFRLSMYNYEFCSHYTAFVMALLCAVLAHDYCRDRGVGQILALAVLIMLMTVSNFIFVLYFVVPMTIVLAAAVLLRPDLRAPALHLIAIHLLALALGMALMAQINRQPLPTYKMHVDNVTNGLTALLHLMPPGDPIVFAVFWLPLTVLGVYGAWALRHRHKASGRTGIAGFLVLAVLANLAFAALYIAREDDVLLRYLAMTTTAPLLIVALGLVRACGARAGHWLALAATVLPAAMYGAGAASSGNLVPTLVRWSPSEAEDLAGCVARYQLKAGLAGYYLARRLMAASGWAVQINQLEPDRPVLYYWGNNRNWFAHDTRHPERAPEYNFVITNRVDYTRTGSFRFVHRDAYDEDAVVQAFGPPDAWVTCGALRVALFTASDGIDRAVADLMARTASPIP